MNSEIESFSYSVSHDLRAPLAAIEGYADMLRRDHAGGLPAEGRLLLERVLGNARQMSCMIDELLDYTHLGGAALRPERVDLARLAREAAAALEPQRRGRYVEIAIAWMPPCVCDLALMRRVYENLIGNALKFTRGTARAVIEIGGESSGRQFVGHVRDNGTGFDMRDAGRLFRVFQRLHPDGGFEGTGTGLAIVKRAIERHGGRVWAEAAPGRGATFRFALPGSDDAG